MAKRNGRKPDGAAQGAAAGHEQQAAPEQPVNGQPTGGRKPPVAEFRVGRIKVAVWENHSPDTGAWYSFTLTRSYKVGDTWKTASSLGVDDLLVAAMILTDARRWHARQTAQARPQPQPRERQPGEGDAAAEYQPQAGGSDDVPF
ncbi:MAG: hypothetical protein K2X87_08050 [Gemmataceae bacterium]|nr:hypothetical protein [Gemmataceae bacterium]